MSKNEAKRKKLLEEYCKEEMIIEES